MRPSTPHYTSPADLRERMTRLEDSGRPYRIQTGIEEFNGGAFRGFMFAILFEAIAIAVVLLVALAVGEVLR